MDDAMKARPVSGEIMTGVPLESPLKQSPSAQPQDFVNADYEVVRPSSHALLARETKPEATVPLSGLGMLREAADRGPRKAQRGGPIFWIAGAVLVAGAFWVSGGHALVRQSTGLVAPSPKATFAISSVTSRVDAAGPHAVLLVDGEVLNDGEAAGTLPDLSILVTTAGGGTIRYNLGTAKRPLAGGERFAFSSRLDVPKDGVKAVSVIFAE